MKAIRRSWAGRGVGVGIIVVVFFLALEVGLNQARAAQPGWPSVGIFARPFGVAWTIQPTKPVWPRRHPRLVRGPRGRQGPRGQVGPLGPQGPQGLPGPMGTNGATGAEGPPGKDGSALPQAFGLVIPEADAPLVRSQNIASIKPVEEMTGTWCIEPEGIDVETAVVLVDPVAPEVDSMEPEISEARWNPRNQLCDESQLEVETGVIELPGGFPKPTDLPFSFLVEGQS